MKQKYHFLQLFNFFLIFSFSAIVYADRDSNIDSIFNWAQANYGNVFPSHSLPPSSGNSLLGIIIVTKRINDFAGHSWHYRYYPDTKIYLGINDEDKVYFYNETDGLVYVDLVPPVLSITNENNVGNGRCANVPLVTSGRKITYKSSWLQNGIIRSGSLYNTFFGTLPHTYTEVSDTKTVITTLSPNNPAFSRVTTDHYVNTNNSMELSNIEVNETGVHIAVMLNRVQETIIVGDVTSKKSYTPTKKSPTKIFCENQSWNSSYTETTKTTYRKVSCLRSPANVKTRKACDANNAFFDEYENETSTEYQISVLSEGNVETINEIITTSAGTFNTVKINRRSSNFFDEPNSVIWLSTEYGVMVYKEDYNKLGVLEKTTELVSLE